MSRKFSLLFFGLAVSLGVLWGVVEFILYEPAGQSHGACNELPQLQFRLKNEILLQQHLQTFWTYDPAHETVRQYRLSSEPVADGLHREGDMPLRCPTPAYDCIAAVANGGPSDLNVVSMTGPSFLLETKGSGRRKIIPALLSNGKIRLSTSLRMCGVVPDGDPSHYVSLPGFIGYWDRDHGRFGLWTIPSYDGALTNEASREPDVVYTLTTAGLQPSGCTESAMPGKAQIFQMGERFLLFADTGDSSLVKAYTLEGGLSPQDIAPLQGAKIQKIWPLDSSSVVLQTAGESAPLRLRWDPKESNWSALPLTLELGKPLNKFVSLNDDMQLNISSGYFLSREEGLITYGNQSLSLPSVDRKWRRTSLGPSALFESTENRFFWGRQSDDDIQFQAYQCPWESRSDKDNTH